MNRFVFISGLSPQSRVRISAERQIVTLLSQAAFCVAASLESLKSSSQFLKCLQTCQTVRAAGHHYTFSLELISH